MRINPLIREALESSGKPWVIEHGSRHLKIRLDDRFVGILPKNGMGSSADRATKNVVAQIKRAARGVTQ